MHTETTPAPSNGHPTADAHAPLCDEGSDGAVVHIEETLPGRQKRRREIVRRAYDAALEQGSAALTFDAFWEAFGAQHGQMTGDMLGAVSEDDLARWGKSQGRMQQAQAWGFRAKKLQERAVAELQVLYADIGERVGVSDAEDVPAQFDPIDGIMRKAPPGAAQRPPPPPVRSPRG